MGCLKMDNNGRELMRKLAWACKAIAYHPTQEKIDAIDGESSLGS
jgi:hypothetical protein